MSHTPENAYTDCRTSSPGRAARTDRCRSLPRMDTAGAPPAAGIADKGQGGTVQGTCACKTASQVRRGARMSGASRAGRTLASTPSHRSTDPSAASVACGGTADTRRRPCRGPPAPIAECRRSGRFESTLYMTKRAAAASLAPSNWGTRTLPAEAHPRRERCAHSRRWHPPW